MIRYGVVISLILGSVSVSSPAAIAQEYRVSSRGPRFVAAGAWRELTPDAQEFAVLRRRVTLALDAVSLDLALKAIVKQAGLEITYSGAVVPIDRLVSLHAQGITVAAALTEVLLGLRVDVSVTRSGHLALLGRSGIPLRHPSGNVTGRVTDAKTGVAIAGADVFLDGTKWRNLTDTNGWYRLVAVDAGTYTLMVRRLGYTKHSQQVGVRAEQDDTAHVTLNPVAVALNELITTATGQQRRRDLGNAITTIRPDSVMQTAPIRNLTDLLEGRVPGLAMQRTSGAPGDPAKLRLRGIGSALRGNDPIVIVDGVRVYSTQSEARSGNLTNGRQQIASGEQNCSPIATSGQAAAVGGTCTPARGGGAYNGDVPAPSPLDQIDPNIIEKIEVFKGPSAATLYGADAANGVIVVTTKKGRPGPSQWTVSALHGVEDKPGLWPEGYYRWGVIPTRGGDTRLCPITETSCQVDSLIRFQALNDPDLTLFGRGHNSSLSIGASGGSQSITYSITGTYNDRLGYIKLPELEAERFRARTGIAVPDWMQRPLRLKGWSVTSNVLARLSSTAEVTLGTRLTRQDQQRSSLERQVADVMGTYVDRASDSYYRPGGIGSFANPVDRLVDEYFRRTTSSTLNVGTSLTGRWFPRSWFTGSAQAGLNIIPRDDEILLPPGFLSSIATLVDSGALSRASGRSLTSDFNLQGSVRKQLGWGFVFETNVGANLMTTTINDLRTDATNLQPGTTTINGAALITAQESRMSTSVFGWYIEPRISGQRLSLSTGIRLDGGSAYGTKLTGTGNGGSLLSLPKLNGSWVISEESWFPLASIFSSLRLRGAYGQAQVQPGPADRLRTYRRTSVPGDASTGTASQSLVEVRTVGNTELRPERSVEFEGGIDADLLDSRLSLEITLYRKTQVDAHMPVKLPPSVNGAGEVIQNIGNIRNTGTEVLLTVVPVHTPVMIWNAQLVYARNTNELVKLGTGVRPNKVEGLVEGYPVRGRWARPILGYADANGNQVLDRNEVQLGDSLVYMGRLDPDYAASLFSNMSFFGGVVTLSAGFTYESGQTQVDQTARSNWVLSQALSDPSAPFSAQAAVLVSDSSEYGVTQDISTFRFNSFAVNYRAPARIARFLRAQELRIGIQGGNLAVHSTYTGKDPDVTTWSPGNVIRDTGQIPMPRTWQVSMNLRY